MRQWIASDGTLMFGKHKGEMIERVVRDDPDYIRWIVESVEDIEDDEREILTTLLRG